MKIEYVFILNLARSFFKKLMFFMVFQLNSGAIAMINNFVETRFSLNFNFKFIFINKN